MQYRSIADMNDTIVRNLHRLPSDIDLIVGIPRSGVLAGSILSLATNLPLTDLDSFLEGRTYTSGITRRWQGARTAGTDRPRRVLILDDSINGGGAMKSARERIAAAGIKGEMIFAAVYGAHAQHVEADLCLETVSQPRLFQWNFMHHKFLAQSCVDIDGVLCHDPSHEENDDGDAYVRFLLDARPLYGPTARIGRLVTSRLEKYRPQTEAWLAARGIAYDELVMLDLPTKAERQRLGVHGSFKADVYRKCDAILFIESEPDQAERIAALSGKPVLCVETHELITPERGRLGALRTQMSASKRSLADRVKHKGRALVGDTLYERVKRLAKR
jgi:uncharacterized HAD superfamily protein/adenine/guanine phosphoribosyltransferase-like PRPP-binding protein